MRAHLWLSTYEWTLRAAIGCVVSLMFLKGSN